MTKGKIFQIQNYSVNDGEGIRTTIFFTGCPLRCVWCSNPENFSEGENLSIDEIINKIKTQIIFYRKSGGGITFSGGESTKQVDFLEKLSARLYDMGIDLAIETCGYFDFEKVRTVFEKMDMIFFDIKHMNEAMHKAKTGVSNTQILENIQKVYKLGKPIVVRIPFIVGFNNSKMNLDELAEFINQKIPKVKVEILPYHRLGEQKYRELGLKLPPENFEIPTPKDLIECKRYLKEKGITLISYD